MFLQLETKDKLPMLFDTIVFKLCRYDIYYGNLLNKRMLPNNILLELHKKAIILEKGEVSPLVDALSKVSPKVGGKHLNLCVMEIDYNS